MRSSWWWTAGGVNREYLNPEDEIRWRRQRQKALERSISEDAYVAIENARARDPRLLRG